MIIDCATCGSPMPADRRCCPHCHCKHSAWKRWAVVASTAALGACGGTSGAQTDLGGHDAAILDMTTQTEDLPEIAVEYGPAPVYDFAGVDGE